MKIFIDADGCPVVDSTIRIAKQHSLACFIMCDTSHVFNKPYATTLVFSKGADSVDFAIVNKVQKNDIVITQDYGLAAMCLAKQAFVLNQDGMEYTQYNIESLLDRRHISKKIRQAGGRVKGPKKRTEQQNIAYENALQSLIEKVVKIQQ